MVAICNTLSMYCSDTDSDIDLFIVTDPRRMWFVRILITGIFHILWVRRHGKKVTKRFCLSFFATTKGLDFNSFRLDHDIYLAYWIYYLKPISDKYNTYGELRKLNENWTEEFFGEDEHCEDEKKWQISRHPESVNRHPELDSGSPNQRPQVTPSKILNLLDSFLQKIFLPKTITHRESLGNPVGIIVNENMLKFHDNDLREEIKKSLI